MVIEVFNNPITERLLTCGEILVWVDVHGVVSSVEGMAVCQQQDVMHGAVQSGEERAHVIGFHGPGGKVVGGHFMLEFGVWAVPLRAVPTAAANVSGNLYSGNNYFTMNLLWSCFEYTCCLS